MMWTSRAGARSTTSVRNSTNYWLVWREAVLPSALPDCVSSAAYRQRAMTEVFKPVTLGAARRKRQYRVEQVERLNRRLSIHAEHCRVLRRIQVQTDEVGRFRFEIRRSLAR
jgi:hypothetical protein